MVGAKRPATLQNQNDIQVFGAVLHAALRRRRMLQYHNNMGAAAKVACSFLKKRTKRLLCPRLHLGVELAGKVIARRT
jgi:hypothetical protein